MTGLPKTQVNYGFRCLPHPMGSLQNIKDDEPYGKMDIERGDLLGMMNKNSLFIYPSHTWLHTKSTPKFPFESVLAKLYFWLEANTMLGISPMSSSFD